MRISTVIKLGVALCILALLVTIVQFGLTAYRVAMRMHEAEVRSHTVSQTCEAIAAYMNDNEGRWPSRWEDLIDVYPQPAWSVEQWPEDFALVQQQVEVDFTTDPKSLRDQTPDSFIAVTPKGDTYITVVDGGYALIIETSRKYD